MGYSAGFKCHCKFSYKGDIMKYDPKWDLYCLDRLDIKVDFYKKNNLTVKQKSILIQSHDPQGSERLQGIRKNLLKKSINKTSQ